jgi:DHA1 family multidrug resistance protein-like MFS transporter
LEKRTREFVGLSTAGLLTYFSYALSRSPIIPLYAQSLGASPQLIGWVVAASTITGIAVKLPAGALSDHFGRKTMLLIGACFFAFTPFFYIFATSVVSLLILRIIHGNATAIFGPSASAEISDITERSRRGVRLGLYSSMQGIGQALGPLLGGVLISWQGFSIPFTISGIIGCIGLVVVLGTFREKSEPTIGEVGKRFAQGIREVISNRAILITSSTVAAQMCVVGAYNAFLPVYAKIIMNLDAWHIGMVFGLQTTTALLARPVMGRFSDNVGRRGIVVVAVIWLGLLIAVLPVIPSFEVLLVFGSAWGLGLSVVSSVAGALITDLSHKAHYGAAHGVFGTIYDIGEASGPIVAGVLVAGLGYSTMFRAMSGLLLIAAIIFGGTKSPNNSEPKI